MNLSQIEAKQPFYFKSYDEVIGVARNVNELRAELAKLLKKIQPPFNIILGKATLCSG